MTSQYDDQIERLEQGIAFHQEQVKRRDALARLDKNADFQLLILHGYLTEVAIMHTHQLADPSQLAEEDQKELINQLRSIAYFKNFLNNVHQMGNTAEREIDTARETLNEIREEGAEE